MTNSPQEADDAEKPGPLAIWLCVGALVAGTVGVCFGMLF